MIWNRTKPLTRFEVALDFVVKADKTGIFRNGDNLHTNFDNGIVYVEYGKQRFNFENVVKGKFKDIRPEIYRTQLYFSIYLDSIIAHVDEETFVWMKGDNQDKFLEKIKHKVDVLNVDKAKKYYESIKNKEKKELNRKKKTEYLGK